MSIQAIYYLLRISSVSLITVGIDLGALLMVHGCKGGCSCFPWLGVGAE